MKRYFISLVLLLIGTSLWAQPNYSLRTNRLPEGKRTNYHLRQSSKLLELGNWVLATQHATKALEVATKKRHIGQAQKWLNELYPIHLIKRNEAVTSLKELTAEFNGDKTVTQAAELIRLYANLMILEETLIALPAETFEPPRKKDTGFQYEAVDYSTAIDAAKMAFKNMKVEAAEMHYAQARSLERSTDKSQLQKAAQRFLWANQYVPEYRDALTRYAAVKKEATTRMAVNRFEASEVKYTNMGLKVSQDLLMGLLSRAEKLKFFEVVDRMQLDEVIKEQELSLSGLLDESTTAEIGKIKGVDIILVGTITETLVDRQTTEPVQAKYTEEVVIRKEKYTTESGEEKSREIKGEVSAKAVESSKSAEVTVGCTYKVIDVATGSILRSGSVVGKDIWNFRWLSKISGDQRAIPKKMAKKESKYPSISDMMNAAANKASQQILSELNNFIKEIGN